LQLLRYGFADNIYSVLKGRFGAESKTLFFSSGWGTTGAVGTVIQQRVLSGAPPEPLRVQWQGPWRSVREHVEREGHFETPLFTEHLPAECLRGHFRLLLPKGEDCPPVCLHLASTGDEGYSRREETMALPLLREGIGSLLLEHPFLGRRRPAYQRTTRLTQVSDLLLLGGVIVEEARALLYWLRGLGFERVGITGISMGGHLAALAGVLTPFKIAIIPCVAPHSGVPVFTEGLISNDCDWAALSVAGEGEEAARVRLRELLGFTSIEHFPPPAPNSIASAVAATDDRFVPRSSSERLRAHWPQAQWRWVEGGHVSSITTKKAVFRQAILDAMRAL
jgi:hypothetical protein